MTDTTFQSYLQDLKEMNVPVLGWVTWYSVQKSAEINRNQLKAKIESHQAPLPIPRVPNMADVFRRACTATEIKKVPLRNNVFINYNLKDAGSDPEGVYRVLVAEKVDSSAHSLGYELMAKLCFDRNSHQVESEPVFDDRSGEWADLTDDPMCVNMVEALNRFVRERGNILSHLVVRDCITTAFEQNLHGTLMKRAGGLYFLDSSQADGLGRVETVINSFEGLSVEMFPVVNHERHRGMVKEAFEDRSLGEARALIEELQELKQKDPIPARRFTECVTRLSEIKEKIAYYQEVLGDNILTSDTTLMVADGLVSSILMKD